jgi:hypothetical protein
MNTHGSFGRLITNRRTPEELKRQKAEAQARFRAKVDARDYERAACKDWRSRLSWGQRLLRNARSSAREKGWELTITAQEIEVLLEPGVCFLTGMAFRLDTDALRDDFAPSLDRIDSSKGYIPGNVRVVCFRVNLMHGNLSDEDFLCWIHLLAGGSLG